VETLLALIVGIIVIAFWIKIMMDMWKTDAKGWFWGTLIAGLLLSPVAGLIVAAVWHFGARSTSTA
jgi:hypothetical protein